LPALPDKFESYESATCSDFETIFSNRIAANPTGPAISFRLSADVLRSLRVVFEEIARKHRVPRTTYEEHVRKAESKIFRAMAPYIRLYASTPQRLGRVAPEIAAK